MKYRFLFTGLLSISLLLLVFAYIALTRSLENDLTVSAKQRMNAVSMVKFNQLGQIYKTNHQDVLALYQWPSLEAQFSQYWESRDSEQAVVLSETLEEFAERRNFITIWVFDNQQNAMLKINPTGIMHAENLSKQHLVRYLNPLLVAASEHFQISASPFYPTLESLYQEGIIDPDIINRRVSFVVAPLIVNEQVIGSVAMARQASDTGFFRHRAMSFDGSGHIVLIEGGVDAMYGLLYPDALDGFPSILVEPINSVGSHWSRVMNGGSGTAFFDNTNGEEVYGHWRYVPEFDIGVLVYEPVSKIYAILRQFHTVAFFSLLATLFIFLIIGWGYTRNIYTKINGLVGRLASISHYGDVVEIKSSSQIDAFGYLIDHMESRIHQDDDVLMSAKQRLRFFMKELEDQRFAFDQHCIIVVADADGTFTDANTQFSDLSGYSRSELIGSSFARFGGDYQNERILKDIFDTMNSGKVWQGELSLLKRSGERYWLETTFVPFINDDGTLRNLVAIHTDITEQKLAYADMIHQAQYDALTGLPNRALLLDRLGQMLRNSRRNQNQVAVLFLDLDDFKKINDSLGHEIGDEFLVEVGRRLKSVIRDQDTVGRLGGDEFLVLLNGTEYKEDVEIVASKIIETIREPILIDEYELVVGVSIGISIYPTDGETESEMLRHADSAMYNTKKMGRNSWSYFTEAMNKDVARRLEIESWMNGAIERGEFSVLFQPIVSVMSGKFATVEALVRWTHPQGGNISPDEFIPIAEHSGYIMEIGRFVLERSLDLAADWYQRYNNDLIVALNASPRQFRDPNWHGGIEEQLSIRGLSTRNIEFEITEGVLISGHDNVERALQEFSDLGIAISMDDFGTGYSSLSYLRNYPFDTLKIDRSFVADIVEHHGDYELVSAAIAMAHGLGLEVVAEGVETMEQYELLYNRRCDYAQGYLFSPPVSGQEILAMGGRLAIDSHIRQQRMSFNNVTTS